MKKNNSFEKCLLIIGLFLLPVIARAQDLSSLSDEQLVQKWADSLPGDKVKAQVEMVRRGKSAALITNLLKVGLHGDENEKVKTIQIFEAFDAVETAPEITRLLDDESGIVQIFAIGALGEFGYSKAVPSLEKTLTENPNKLFKISSMYALGKIGDKSAIAPIRQYINSDDDYVRAVSADTLAKLGDRSGYEPVKKILAGQSVPEAKMVSLEALGILGTKDDLGLIDQVESSDQAKSEPMVHDFVQVARYSISSRGLSDADKINEINKLLNPNMPLAAQWAIHEMGNNHSTVFLSRLKKLKSDADFKSFDVDINNELRKNGINN